MTFTDVGFYDVIVSNDVGELRTDSTFFTQMRTEAGSVEFTYPANSGLSVFQSMNLIDWSVDGLSLVVSDDVSVGLETTSVSLSGGPGDRFVRLGWEP